MSVGFDFKSVSDQVRDQLLGDPFFSSIPATSGAAVVISADPHDIITEINAALNEIGLGLLVLLPVAKNSSPNLKGPYFDDVRVIVKIFESPTVNRPLGNPTAYAAAMMVCALLHQFTPDGVDECFVITECIPVADDEFIVWQVTAKTEAGLIFSQPPIAPVLADITEPGDQLVTLSCATIGAPIWYTFDGTYPSPRGPTSRLVIMKSFEAVLDDDGIPVYDSNNLPVLTGAGIVNFPIKVLAGQLLRARAWLPGYAAPTPTETNIKY